MPKKMLIVLKGIGRYWFLFLVLIIVIIAIYNREIALWLTAITLVLFLVSYFPTLFSRVKIMRLTKKYYKIEDIAIAQELKKPIRKIREKLFDLSHDQKKKKWLIVFLNKRYIFYHQDTIEKFKEVYNKEHDIKKILQNLKEFKVKTLDEVKAIKEALIRFERIEE